MVSPDTHSLTSALHHYFGFSDFRPLQREAIEAALRGEDVLVVMPTGSGKSLCFQLPAAIEKGLTLVISPLVALMRDQVAALQSLPNFRKLGVAALSSLQSSQERAEVLRDLADERIRLLYVSPERFRSAAFQRALDAVKVARLVVDEAHCISEWGHDFRPDYLQLSGIVNDLGNPPIIAVTATATQRVRESIIHNLGMRDPRIFIGGFNRPNLHYSVHRCKSDAHRKEKLMRALPKLCAKNGGSGLIYVATRKQAEEIADAAVQALEPLGIRAAAYHAGLTTPTRLELQRAWQNGEISVLVATNAFGMGIDKPDVRFVVHYIYPESLESYYQESGRAGRDGKPSRCVILYHFADQRLREWFIENDSLTADDVQELQQLILRNRDRNIAVIQPNEWARKLRWSGVKLRLAIGQLERSGMIERIEEDAEQCTVRLLQRKFSRGALTQIAESFDAQQSERKRRLRQIIAYCKTTACRRRKTLDYFGDTAELPDKSTFCCDNCSNPPSQTAQTSVKLDKVPMPEVIDPQDIFAVLQGLDALFPQLGKNRLNKLLRGSGKDIQRFRDAECPLLGIFEGASLTNVNQFIDDLIAAGLMQRGDEDEYFVCSITAKGRAAWQNQTSVKVLLPLMNREQLGVSEKVLLKELKHWRSEQAHREEVPPLFRSKILTNRTLLELAHQQPQDKAELQEIFGIGKVKLHKYGDAILNLIQQHNSE